MKVLITGAAGFIGSTLSLKLLERGDEILGIDNHNNYYDPALKAARLERHKNYANYKHVRMDIKDRENISKLFKTQQFECVINLAAAVGIRYSLKNPAAYIDSNLVGFSNILEGCRQTKVAHLIYASSSSVYGANSKIPFSENDSANHPVSLYGATKKANELMAHSYAHLYNFATTGLRFFTVYGPWDRPDMALQKFAQAMLKGEPVQLFNYGKHCRDFTYIDDIIKGIMCVIDKPAVPNLNWNSYQPDAASSCAPYRIYNIGNRRQIKLDDYISALEKALGIRAQKEYLPMQAGDIVNTYASVEMLERDFNYKPDTSIQVGVENFANWYQTYYQ